MKILIYPQLSTVVHIYIMFVHIFAALKWISTGRFFFAHFFHSAGAPEKNFKNRTKMLTDAAGRAKV
jgi:uncharacterized membrane protein